MGKFQKLKKIWSVIVNEWKTRYRLVFSNEDTHEQSLVIKKITIQKMVVVTILSAFVLIFLTTIIIALTPLRMYIPGYTTQKDYKLYKQTAARVQEELVAKATTEAQTVIENAKKQAAMDTQREKDALKGEFARLVALATSQVTGKVLTEDDHRKINDEAIKAL